MFFPFLSFFHFFWCLQSKLLIYQGQSPPRKALKRIPMVPVFCPNCIWSRNVQKILAMNTTSKSEHRCISSFEIVNNHTSTFIERQIEQNSQQLTKYSILIKVSVIISQRFSFKKWEYCEQCLVGQSVTWKWISISSTCSR